MMVVLGPCPCKACGVLVVFDGRRWLDAADLLGHSCRHANKIGRRAWLTPRGLRWVSNR